jgi:hypothetical protein
MEGVELSDALMFAFTGALWTWIVQHGICTLRRLSAVERQLWDVQRDLVPLPAPAHDHEWGRERELARWNRRKLDYDPPTVVQ